MKYKNNLIRICQAVDNGEYSSQEFLERLETSFIEDDAIQNLIEEVKYNLELDIYTVLEKEQMSRRRKYAKQILMLLRDHVN